VTVSARRLWFAGFGAAAAWSFDLMAVVSVGSTHCLSPVVSPATHGTVWWVVAAITGAAWIVGVGSLLSTVRAWRAPGQDGAARRARFMAFGGVLLNALFLVGLFFSSVALLLAPLCY